MKILYANKKKNYVGMKEKSGSKNEWKNMDFLCMKEKQGYFENEWIEGKFKCNEKEKSYSKEWKISKSLRENIVPVGMKERKKNGYNGRVNERKILC